MKPYTATGRHGKVNVRHFRSVMTHAVDVDGLVWKFFSSVVSAEEYAAEKAAEGYDAVVVAAKPYVPADAVDADDFEGASLDGKRAASAILLGKFKHLLELKGYTNEDLTDALREEGVVMAAEVSRRLLAGVGGSPSDSTVEALARVFDVEPDHFFESGDEDTEEAFDPTVLDVHDVAPSDDPVSSAATDVGEPTPGPARYRVPIERVGLLIQGLSDAADRCLQPGEADIGLAIRLTGAISSISQELRQADGTEVSMSPALLEEIVIAWARSAPSNTPSRGDYLWTADLLGRHPTV